MKKSIFVLGVAALAVAMVSCNKDEIKKIDNPTFEGDKAYVVVNINDVTKSGTRATDGGFQYGSEDEYAVSTASFYFYGSDGDFVTEADVNDFDGTATEYEQGGEYGNIEFKGYTVIALTGLTSKDYPNWVVTVLNGPTDFKAPDHLSGFEGLLADENAIGITDADGNYTMATSSFVPSSDQREAGYSSTYYYATPVSSSNFALESLSGDSTDGYTDANGDNVDPVVIYVERLAAKATLAVSESLTGDVTDGSGNALYKITVQEETEGVATETEVYVRIDGWTLNGTAKYSNLVKTIDPTWTTTDLWTDWNDATNYRSYWGESFNYGAIGDYPSSAADGNNENGGYYDGTSYSDYLSYVSYNDCSNDVSTSTSTVYEYCAENTNTAGESSEGIIITDKTSTAITNLLISATVCDAEGQPLDLVRSDGVLYTQDDFLAYAANHIHLYTLTSTGSDVYTQIDASYLTLANRVDGKVDVVLDGEALSSTTLYNADQETIGAADANAYIDTAFNAVYGLDANGYAGGAMYYSIPIEHLNNGTVEGDDDKEYPAEGNYGIVRNHIYAITITGIENIGYGVFDPDEIIIPQPEPETYAITTQINILSWKLVNQSVTL